VPPRASGGFNALPRDAAPQLPTVHRGQLVSLSGTWMQSTAQLWLVYKLTGSAALLVSSGFANQVPMLFLSSLGATSGTTTTGRRWRHVDANRFDDSGICAGGTGR